MYSSSPKSPSSLCLTTTNEILSHMSSVSQHLAEKHQIELEKEKFQTHTTIKSSLRCANRSLTSNLYFEQEIKIDENQRELPILNEEKQEIRYDEEYEEDDEIKRLHSPNALSSSSSSSSSTSSSKCKYSIVNSKSPVEIAQASISPKPTSTETLPAQITKTTGSRHRKAHSNSSSSSSQSSSSSCSFENDDVDANEEDEDVENNIPTQQMLQRDNKSKQNHDEEIEIDKMIRYDLIGVKLSQSSSPTSSSSSLLTSNLNKNENIKNQSSSSHQNNNLNNLNNFNNSNTRKNVLNIINEENNDELCILANKDNKSNNRINDSHQQQQQHQIRKEFLEKNFFVSNVNVVREKKANCNNYDNNICLLKDEKEEKEEKKNLNCFLNHKEDSLAKTFLLVNNNRHSGSCSESNYSKTSKEYSAHKLETTRNEENSKLNNQDCCLLEKEQRSQSTFEGAISDENEKLIEQELELIVLKQKQEGEEFENNLNRNETVFTPDSLESSSCSSDLVTDNNINENNNNNSIRKSDQHRNEQAKQKEKTSSASSFTCLNEDIKNKNSKVVQQTDQEVEDDLEQAQYRRQEEEKTSSTSKSKTNLILEKINKINQLQEKINDINNRIRTIDSSSNSTISKKMNNLNKSIDSINKSTLYASNQPHQPHSQTSQSHIMQSQKRNQTEFTPSDVVKMNKLGSFDKKYKSEQNLMDSDEEDVDDEQEDGFRYYVNPNYCDDDDEPTNAPPLINHFNLSTNRDTKNNKERKSQKQNEDEREEDDDSTSISLSLGKEPVSLRANSANKEHHAYLRSMNNRTRLGMRRKSIEQNDSDQEGEDEDVDDEDLDQFDGDSDFTDEEDKKLNENINQPDNYTNSYKNSYQKLNNLNYFSNNFNKENDASNKNKLVYTFNNNIHSEYTNESTDDYDYEYANRNCLPHGHHLEYDDDQNEMRGDDEDEMYEDDDEDEMFNNYSQPYFKQAQPAQQQYRQQKYASTGFLFNRFGGYLAPIEEQPAEEHYETINMENTMPRKNSSSCFNLDIYETRNQQNEHVKHELKNSSHASSNRFREDRNNSNNSQFDYNLTGKENATINNFLWAFCFPFLYFVSVISFYPILFNFFR
jgi:hypothetical protein